MKDLLIQENVSLQAYNTLALPAFSRWFAEVETELQLQQALQFQQEKDCALLVLGGGSNVVLVDDFVGLSIIVNTQGLVIEKETDESVFLSVAAGECWHSTVMYCVAQGWNGVENLALIPGRVGAAPIQNIGAYGVELTQCFSYLEAIDIATGERLYLDNRACEFAYRDSVFKHRLKDKLVITRVVLQLSKQAQWTLDYPALKKPLAAYDHGKLTSAIIADTVIAIRSSKLPDPSDIPNAGSFFKNPIVSAEFYDSIKRQYPNAIAFSQAGNSYKLAAGWLLDNAGWRGKLIDGIAMHKDQALVLTNPNRVDGRALLHFVRKVTDDIKQKYAIELEIEPRIYPAAP
jgi:UDP-N-acetylmuramate dehydrogenase